MIDVEQLRQWRDEACENIERIDSARGQTPGQKHVSALLRPREARILTLCDALLDCIETANWAPERHPYPIPRY